MGCSAGQFNFLNGLEYVNVRTYTIHAHGVKWTLLGNVMRDGTGPLGNRFYSKIIEPVAESIIMEAFTANKSRVWTFSVVRGPTKTRPRFKWTIAADIYPVSSIWRYRQSLRGERVYEGLLWEI